MRNHVLIFVNGQRHEVRGGHIFQPLSTWLRNDLGLTGTKVVCSEGDCGSCSLFLGRMSADHIEYRAVCGCIQYLYQLDGLHVVTIEGLSDGGNLNAIQQAMVRCQGTQCGFCTPGFVVAMHSLMQSGETMTASKLQRGLVGNLCRCTGYEPILRAGLEVDVKQVRPLDQLFDSAMLLPDMRNCIADSVLVQHEAQTFFKPATIAEAVRFKSENPLCAIICGGSDLGVQLNKGMRQISSVMSIGALEQISKLEVAADQMIVGAAASLTDLEHASVSAIPEYAHLLKYFGSPLIKNAGTLGGNIANGSPIGDSMPCLFVLNAEIELTGTAGARRVNINEFYTGYRKSVARSDELITRVFIPLPKPTDRLKLYKVSKRKDLDISSFAAAIWLQLNGKNILDARIAYGGVGPTIIRLPQTEAHLKGATIAEDLFTSAAEIAAQEVTPISDVRGSAGYRQQLAANILRKFYFDVFETGEQPHYRGNGNGSAHGADANGTALRRI